MNRSTPPPGSLPSTPRGAVEARLVALDIDGTLLQTGQPVPPVTVRAVAEVRAAGHHVVLATGRSLVGALPVARHLGLDGSWVVASNGAVTAQVDQAEPDGYRVHEARTFDVEPVARLALRSNPRVRVAVEKVGLGWHVNHQFDPRQLNGPQDVVTHTDQLWARPATRVVLAAPNIRTLVEPLGRLGVTPSAAGRGWVDVTPRGLSKASALEAVRDRLGVLPERTVAIGDSWNDQEMLRWAHHPVAMGHAPEAIKALAQHVTGPIERDGAANALRALLGADTTRPATVPA